MHRRLLLWWWTLIEAGVVKEFHYFRREHSLFDLRDHLHDPFFDHGLGRLLLLLVTLRIVDLISGLHLVVSLFR